MTAESHFVLSVIILVLVAVVQENKIVFSVPVTLGVYLIYKPLAVIASIDTLITELLYVPNAIGLVYNVLMELIKIVYLVKRQTIGL